MKVYRNDYFDDDGLWRRCGYFAKKRDAQKAAKTAGEKLNYRTQIHSLNIQVTKKGVMRALNEQAYELFNDD